MAHTSPNASNVRLAVPRKPTRSQLLDTEYAGQIAYPSQQTPPHERTFPANTLWSYFAERGWDELVHPNGVLYYHHRSMNVTTTANLREIDGWDPLVFLAQLASRTSLPETGARISNGYEVLVELDGITWINHNRQAASELNEDFLTFRLRQNSSSYDPSLSAEYWSFVQRCPCHVGLSKSSWTEAYTALTWAYADRLLFGVSNASFSKDDSKELLQILHSL
ncbi:hypothetical protein EXIGLDRAFT_773497 [Exidia glandulosa HHB12029]|uniref:WW domain-containing protein n=1 Tax=Exidia glandulosa HHB12029 TaxID=1314781 RepID=A0A165ESI2_EXIGL|nr:hypothetical protein EXIGLDRAFT_773497 [Exidia glandulosa HHB12029]